LPALEETQIQIDAAINAEDFSSDVDVVFNDVKKQIDAGYEG
jgi:hypothetical protein